MGSVVREVSWTEEDLDVAEPIGATDQSESVGLRRVSLCEDGQVRFGDEEPARLFRNVFRSIPGASWALGRFEVKALRGSPISVSDWLVLTEFPYHNSWQVRARFKKGLRRCPEERCQHVDQALRSLDVATVSEGVLEKLSHDVFETGSALTAAVSPPISFTERPRSLGQRGKWVFGVCRDVSACLKALLEGDEAKRLIELTERGALHVGPPDHRIPLDPRVWVEARSTLLISALQALAGPLSGEDVPAMTLTRRIFESHLCNRTRQLRSEPLMDSIAND